ncbi:c-type cytochrome [Polluticaenibacter yanchengensis]|uniref:Cytochrome c n=1 Tax=Polluticaenibacter yanchengensis TaxID=3014562 RepID=A0ABT4UG02_9BACT|nr:cytochrome c [Chitinophagaceae bacterium LY-5]
MKKLRILLIVPVIGIFQFCGSSKKATETKTTAPVAKAKTISFETDVKPIVMNTCAPCHTVGKKSHLFEYDIAKEHIDETIERIKKGEADRGFMPKNGKKMSDADIAVFEQWKANGFAK